MMHIIFNVFRKLISLILIYIKFLKKQFVIIASKQTEVSTARKSNYKIKIPSCVVQFYYKIYIKILDPRKEDAKNHVLVIKTKLACR